MNSDAEFFVPMLHAITLDSPGIDLDMCVVYCQNAVKMRFPYFDTGSLSTITSCYFQHA